MYVFALAIPPTPHKCINMRFLHQFGPTNFQKFYRKPYMWKEHTSMYIQLFRNIMYGERRTVTTNNQDKYTITPDDERSVMENDDEPTAADSELSLLVEKYGPLEKGQTIEVTLQEALQIWPRERKKSDAYKGLVKRVKEQLNVELKIGGKKNG